MVGYLSHSFVSMAHVFLSYSLASASLPSQPIDTVREAVGQGAEVHAILTTQPAIRGLSGGQVADWPSMALALRDRKGVAGRMWDMLSADARKAVLDDTAIVGLTESPLNETAGKLIARVGYDLQRIVGRDDFYDERVFKGVPIDKEMQALIDLGAKRTTLDTLRLNRALMATAFPTIVAPVPKNYQTIRVTVTAGKPVVLVLSSFQACYWEVIVEKGASVAGVVLGGYYYQEVTGVGAVPVVYRVTHGPNRAAAVPLDKPLPYYSSDDPDGKTFSAAVRELLKATSISLQRTSETTLEPFVVRPGKK